MDYLYYLYIIHSYPPYSFANNFNRANMTEKGIKRYIFQSINFSQTFKQKKYNIVIIFNIVTIVILTY